MTVYVFIGPTLRSQDVLAVAPDAVCLPPVAQGDVYRVARRRPHAIGIVDGYFTGAPSVWHKEILWALAQGIAVFGSASMGALRAAELHAFGMTGVGEIFEAYRDGALEDDDEVAVVHGPPETGFIAASEPMVNIRATLERAEQTDVISAATRTQLETTAKALFFAHRTWPNVFKAMADQDLAAEQLSAFREWLPQGAVDRKREDALAMLAAMQVSAVNGVSLPSNFRFEQTYFWDDLVERIEGDALVERQTSVPAGILDEVRLLGPDAYRSVMRNALLRLLAEREAQRRGFTPPPETKTAVISKHREDLGLHRRSQLDDWLSQNGLDEASYHRLLEQEALLGQFTEASSSVLMPYFLDELRLSGKFHQLITRARDKADRIDGGSATASAAFPNTVQLRIWYFEDRLGVPMPDDVRSIAAALGFDTIEQFDLTLRREWMYTQVIRGGLGGLDNNDKDDKNAQC